MRTNQNLIRKMGDFDIYQRTSDGMFNATELLKQWNKQNGMKKEMKDYFDNKSAKEFIQVIIDRENLNKGNSPYLKTRGRENGGTWMHPLLFIDFAMWINPAFKYDVLRFVYDELIKYRNDAGDAYREMSEQIAKLSNGKDIANNIKKVAEAINYISQNQHEKMIRNKADESQMKEYVRIEKEVTMLIKKGFVKSFESLMDYLRNEWKQKYSPKVFAGK